MMTLIGTCQYCVFRSGGYCENPKITEPAGEDENATDQLVYCYDESGAFRVGPDFGCIHFKAITETI